MANAAIAEIILHQAIPVLEEALNHPDIEQGNSFDEHLGNALLGIRKASSVRKNPVAEVIEEQVEQFFWNLQETIKAHSKEEFIDEVRALLQSKLDRDL